MTEKRRSVPWSLIFKIVMTVALFGYVINMIPLQDTIFVVNPEPAQTWGQVIKTDQGAFRFKFGEASDDQAPVVSGFENRPIKVQRGDETLWLWVEEPPVADQPFKARRLTRYQGELEPRIRPAPDAEDVVLNIEGVQRTFSANEVAGGFSYGVEPGFPTLMRSIDKGLFVICFFLMTICHFMPALRWRILLTARGVNISKWMAIKLCYMGIFFSQFMPSTVGGDVIRAYYVARDNAHDRQTSALSVFIDRVVGLLGILIIGTVAVAIQYENVAIQQYGTKMAIFVAIILLGACIYFSRTLRKLFAVDRILEVLPMGRRLREIEAKVFAYRDNKKAILKALILTIAIQANFIFVNHLIAVSLGMPTDRYGDIFVILPIVTVLVAIPISLGGFGFREYLFVHFFTIFGLDAGIGFATSLIQGVLTLIWSLLGGLVFLSLRKQALAGQEMLDPGPEIVETS